LELWQPNQCSEARAQHFDHLLVERVVDRPRTRLPATKPLRNLAPGKRVFAYVGGAGYVGIGEVTGEMPSQVTVCKLRDDRTIEVVTTAMELADSG
jgi:hypothetical protein